MEPATPYYTPYFYSTVLQERSVPYVSTYSYNPRSWIPTFRLSWSPFVAVPWAGATLFCLLLTYLEHTGYNAVTWLSIPPTATMIVAGALSFLMVFRINTSYARWWEARVLWGSVTVQSRALMGHASCCMKSHEDLTQLATELLTFSVALKNFLRGVDTTPDQLGSMLDAETLRQLNKAKRPPLYAAEAMIRTLRNGLSTEGVDGMLLIPTYQVLSDTVHQLVQASTGCERIKTSPMPLGYVAALRSFLVCWLFTLPFALIGPYDWIATVAVGMISFLFLTLEEVAMEIEQPFGKDANDLPLETFCLNIESTVLDSLNRNAQKQSVAFPSGAFNAGQRRSEV